MKFRIQEEHIITFDLNPQILYLKLSHRGLTMYEIQVWKVCQVFTDETKHTKPIA